MALTWLTGASSGIGFDLAKELQARGQPLVVSARSMAPLAQLAAHEGTNALPLDVTMRDKVADAVAKIEQDFGPIETAIFNAGTHLPVEGDQFNADGFSWLMNVNVMGVVHCLEAVIPAMVARGRGRIVIVASVAGYRGLPTASYYGATKAALINMAEALRLDLKKHGIVVQLVNPGFVKTPLTDKNEFPMPFLMDSKVAAKRFADGIETDKFEITFPRRFAMILKLLRMLPYALYFPLVGRGTGK